MMTRRKILKLAILETDDTVTGSKVQVIKADGPALKKSKLGKFLGKKCGIGTSGQIHNSSVTPLQNANNELMIYLQYPQRRNIDACPLSWWKEYFHLSMLSNLAH